MFKNYGLEKINMEELYFHQKKSEEQKIKTYQKVLARVHTKIKCTSRIKKGENHCFFLLPEFMMGVPKFDVGACTSYIIDNLLENGFMVKYTHPNLLFISWNHYIPNYQRDYIKKETGVTVDGFGNVLKEKEDTKMLTNGKQQSANKILKKKDNKDYKSINSYKPSGNFIYDKNMMLKIQDMTN